MSYTRSDGTSTPLLAGLVQLASGFRINDGTFVLTSCGLFDSPPLRPGVGALPYDHGGYAGTPFYDPWFFTIEGYLTVPVLADVWPAKDDLRGKFNLDAGLLTLTLNTSGWSATRQTTARVAGPIQFLEPVMFEKLVPDRDFVIPMVAPDPRIYATTLQSVTVDASEALTNGGTASTPFTVRFNGPQTNPKIDGPGTAGTNRIRYGGTIAGGDWVEVSTNPNAVGGVSALDQAGVNVYPDVSAFTARVVTPGTTTWSATNDSGAGTTVMKFRDAWT